MTFTKEYMTFVFPNCPNLPDCGKKILPPEKKSFPCA